MARWSPKRMPDYCRLAAEMMNSRPRELFMRSVFIPSHKIIYFTNPKVAGTTIIATLLKAEKSPYQRDHNVPEARHAIGWERDPEAFWSALHDPLAFKFAFVRNPYTRILSVYLEKVRNEHKIRAGIGLESGEQITLLQFLRFVVKQKPDDMDRHWRPQSEMIPVAIRLNLIGKLERFDEDFSLVLRRLGLPSYEERRRHRTNADTRLSLIGPEEKEIIDTIYANDFQRFGYPMVLSW